MCFKMKAPSVNMPTVTTTARDLVPERTSQEPESPIFGGDEDTPTSTNFADSAKKKGVQALQIKPKTTTGYNPVNNYFNK